MIIRQLRVLATKAKIEDKDEEQDVLAVVVQYNEDATPPKEGEDPKDTDFVSTFPVELFSTPAGYGHAIEIAITNFNKFLQEKAEKDAGQAEGVVQEEVN